MTRQKRSRRDFIRMASTTTVAASVAPSLLAAGRQSVIAPRSRVSTRAPSDNINIATVGMGIIGFVDTEAALEVPGTRFVAAADCYDGRLERTNEVFGSDVFTTRDYREILSRSDVDAVLVCTPDHWHKQISIDAMEAGKAVYCEKPMVWHLEEGPAVIEAQQRTGQVFQVGSQYAANRVYHKAKELYESGSIGQLMVVEGVYNRNSALGAWQYSLPPDAAPERIDWDRFLGSAPTRPFDPVRFFRWRNYRDYGTGVAGDLFVHLFTAIHLVVGSNGPSNVAAMGGLRFWHDGRDVPDVILGLFDYPEAASHPAFTLSLQCNFADGGGSGSHFRFVGSDGAMTIDRGGITLTRQPRRSEDEDRLVKGYNSVRTFSTPVQEEFARRWREENPVGESPEMNEEHRFVLPEGYDARLDHFMDFFESMRSGHTAFEDAAYGYRAAAPSLIANQSLDTKRTIEWDPEAMKVRI
ncbi:MAG: Gfo/Idh/MocA family oxidoreductase [Rhodothermia bacterium]|nr:Gfo/Idh/MocA family oxidoreductase [Rhodothermia bacterium]